MSREYECFDDTCAQCGKEFSEENPCCCDEDTHEPTGLHRGGVCRSCCGPHAEGFAAWGFGVYERMDV